MGRLDQLLTADRQNLEEEVRSYVKNNYYHHSFNGMTQFICLGLVQRQNGTIYPDLASKGAIYTPDKKWEKGLRNIGRKYGLDLSLARELYVSS